MSRVERQKMKKEAREKQKEKLKKKKGKDNIVNSEGDWNVEHINTSNHSPDFGGSDIELDVSDDEEKSSVVSDEHFEPENESDENQSDENQSHEEPTLLKENISEKTGKDSSRIQRIRRVDKDKQPESERSDSDGKSDNDDDNAISNDVRHTAKLGPVQQENKFELKIGKPNKNAKENKVSIIQKSDKKQRDKNKNFNEKILNRKFKKDSDDTPQKETKVVDPFFITSTGENYMSLAEPRSPDEVKEFHKEGNRKLRRAVMFGHAPRIKPRQEFRQDNENRFNRHRQNGFDKGFDRQNQKHERFNRRDNIGRDNFKYNDKFNKEDNFQINKFRDNQRTNINDRSDNSAKPEKLHPSWEAKKRQSGILPFKGKKVVFSDD